MRALVTGISGFAGSHLAENLLQHNYDVFGTALPGENLRNLKGIMKQVTLERIVLDDQIKLKRIIRKARPHYVFHLAAMAAVGKSFAQPLETMQVNLIGTLKLYEALREIRTVEKIIFVSSADVFGPLPPSRMPIQPDYPLHPVSPYGASKAAADILSFQYHRAFGLPIVRVRAFNHTGPRQTTGFVIPDFCSQIAAIEKSSRKGTIMVGNLSAKRDLSDVRDIVNGYRLAAERGRAGEAYILASGSSDSIENHLRLLVSFSEAGIRIKVDKSLLRPVEVPLLVGSISKARRELGYKPRIGIKQTLQDTLEYWRGN